MNHFGIIDFVRNLANKKSTVYFFSVVKKHVLFNHALNTLYQILIGISLFVYSVYALLGCS